MERENKFVTFWKNTHSGLAHLTLITFLLGLD